MTMQMLMDYIKRHTKIILVLFGQENLLIIISGYTNIIALGKEYKHRYGREHASITKLSTPLFFAPDNIEDKGLTPLAQAMPDEYKNEDPIVAYRNYNT